MLVPINSKIIMTYILASKILYSRIQITNSKNLDLYPLIVIRKCYLKVLLLIEELKKINCKSSHKTLIIIADPLTVLKINQYQITR